MEKSLQLITLQKDKYKYHELNYRYTSDEHYKASFSGGIDGFSFSFTRVKLREPIKRNLYDTLYQDYWQEPSAYGVKPSDCGLDASEDFIAYLELDRELWNERLRITQLLVKEKYRGQKIGKLLIEKAKSIAREEDFRLIVLETQSCNVKAIDFYLSQGFVFSGTNLHFYSNDDICENEVMLEMVYLLQ